MPAVTEAVERLLAERKERNEVDSRCCVLWLLATLRRR